jgi:hypothetical protein
MVTTMVRIIISVVIAALAAVAIMQALGSGVPSQQNAAATAPMRIGVYDSRAIAIAYAASEFNPVAAKMQELREAHDAGDQDRIRELEAWGARHQRELHRQGFSRVPVTDLFESVRDQLPALAEKLGVDAIAFECNYIADAVEEVDITLDLVSLFDPSEQAMNWIRESLKAEPVDLDELEMGHDG